MIKPLPELLRAVERFLPRDLVGRGARRVMRERARQVPSEWFSACVECRLTADAEQNDLLVYATRGRGGQQDLGRLLKGGGGQEFGTARPFLAEWTRRGSPLHRELPAIWLEYDLPTDKATGARLPDPFAFVCLYPDYLDPDYPKHRFGSPLPAGRIRSIAAAGLRASLGEPAERRRLDLVTRCAARLPMHGRMFHVVGMPHRGTRDLRIGAILPASGLERWLDDIGWTGQRRQLRLLEKIIGGGFALLHVQIELGEDIRPRLALDFHLNVLPSETDRWAKFVDGLAATGCCERDKARAALSWLGSRPVKFDGDPLPARIDHQLFYKVTSTPDTLEAKAYLCFQPRYALL